MYILLDLKESCHIKKSIFIIIVIDLCYFLIEPVIKILFNHTLYDKLVKLFIYLNLGHTGV